MHRLSFVFAICINLGMTPFWITFVKSTGVPRNLSSEEYDISLFVHMYTVKHNIRYYNFFFLLFFGVFLYRLPLPPLRGQPAVVMPTLLAPQQGMTCPCRLERCRIRTQDCRFNSLATTSLNNNKVCSCFKINFIISDWLPGVLDAGELFKNIN